MANTSSERVEGLVLGISRDNHLETTGWVSAAWAPGISSLQATVTCLGGLDFLWAWSIFEFGITGWVGDRREALIDSEP